MSDYYDIYCIEKRKQQNQISQNATKTFKNNLKIIEKEINDEIISKTMPNSRTVEARLNLKIDLRQFRTEIIEIRIIF